MGTTDSKKLALTACKALSEKRGRDIVTLYVRERTSLCDYFVIASAGSAAQIKAMGERVEELVEKELGIEPTRAEGVRDGRWGEDVCTGGGLGENLRWWYAQHETLLNPPLQQQQRPRRDSGDGRYCYIRQQYNRKFGL